MISIIILTIVGAIVAAALGTFWYSGATPMGKTHMRFLGFDKLSPEEQKRTMEEAKPKMPKMYAAQIFLSLLMSFSVALIVTESIHNGLPFFTAAGFVIVNWLCFVVPVAGTNVLWSNCDGKLAWQKFFSDIFYYLVLVVILAAIAGSFA